MRGTELRIDLLGGFRVTVRGVAVPDDVWRRRKPGAVLKLLALGRGHRLRREQLMDALWPDLAPGAAAANLRKAVHELRTALDRTSRGAGESVVSDRDLLTLVAPVLDVDEFRTSLAAARRANGVGAYRQALDLYRGELLPDDAYEEWATAPRRELHLQYLAALTEVVALLEARGELEAATEAASRLVVADPSGEEGHAALMRLYALAGRRSDALRQYEHLQRTLDEELGAEPGPAVQRLYEEIRSRRSGEPELSADLWERVGDLRSVSGDHEGAAKAFGQALDAAPGGASTGAARLERKCADAWLMRHRPDMAEPHLAAAAENPATDPAERARLLRTRAQHGWETGDIDGAQVFAERARGAALDHGTADDVAAAYEAVAIVAHFKGEWREGLASELERLASDDADVAQLGRVFEIHHCIGQYHLYGDGLSDSVEDYARRILDRAIDAAALRAQAFAWCLLGESLLLQGRWDEADGCLARSCSIHATLDSRSGALPWQRRAEMAVCRGDQAGAEDHLRTASGIATVSVMAAHVWGRIYAVRAFAAVERGEVDAAVRAVQDAAGAASRYGDCPTCSALLNPVAAEVFALLPDPGAAESYAGAAGRVAEQFRSTAWRAMADSAAGSAAHARADHAAAEMRYAAAAEGYARAGQPYWADRSARLAATAAR